MYTLVLCYFCIYTFWKWWNFISSFPSCTFTISLNILFDFPKEKYKMFILHFPLLIHYTPSSMPRMHTPESCSGVETYIEQIRKHEEQSLMLDVESFFHWYPPIQCRCWSRNVQVEENKIIPSIYLKLNLLWYINLFETNSHPTTARITSCPCFLRWVNLSRVRGKTLLLLLYFIKILFK